MWRCGDRFRIECTSRLALRGTLRYVGKAEQCVKPVLARAVWAAESFQRTGLETCQ